MKFDSIITTPYRDNIAMYAPGVEPTLNDATIYPFLHASEKSIVNTIGDTTYAKIRELPSDDLLKQHIVAALSNLVMYNYKVWEVVQKRQVQQQDTYKYELELMQSAYIDNYYSHVDDVIKLLNDRSESFTEVARLPAYKLIDQLLIKDAAEFDSYYCIDSSYYFFFTTTFIQRKVLDKHIETVLDVASLDEATLRRVKTITAQLTVAYALRQRDFIELPKSIRNSRADGPSRASASEQSAVIELSNYLFNESEKELSALVFDVNKPDVGEDIPSYTDTNDPDNKFFLMS